MPRILPVELKEFDATSLTGLPQDFGDPLDNPAIKVNFINTSDVDCYVGSDSVPVQNFRVPAGGTLTLDESTLYFRGCDQEFYLPKGCQLSVTQVTGAGTSGAIIAHIVTRVL
jgi:hypothetical protein